ncbi:hypothetical protein OPQ81_003436 [Rhizoctonia solani]|nr:hypothetical protein OPQ81_003436 [Rhizoctonia solani]
MACINAQSQEFPANNQLEIAHVKETLLETGNFIDLLRPPALRLSVEEADQATPWKAPAFWISSGQVFEDHFTHDALTGLYPSIFQPSLTIRFQSKGHLNRSRAEMDGGMPNGSHFDDPVNLNDPLFFHPQHPRSLENFDSGEFGHSAMSSMTEKLPAIPQRLYPAYQLPGLSYGVRPDGSVLVGARYNYPAPNKRSMDAAQQDIFGPKYVFPVVYFFGLHYCTCSLGFLYMFHLPHVIMHSCFPSSGVSR